MQPKASGFVAIAAVAGLLASCGENRMGPTSPSLTSLRSSGDVARSRSAAPFAPKRVDEDGDGYEDPVTAPADPAMPPPNPGEVPPPEVPLPEGVPLPVPVQLTVNIVGSFGTLAFAPNPLEGTVGNTIVWTNTDVVPHIIVLDDGTPVGSLAPGQSSAPIPLNTPTASYHCTIHTSMTGQIVPVPALPSGEPLPGDPSHVPFPGPGGPGPAPAPTDPYGDDYGDGYDYDYGYDDDY